MSTDDWVLIEEIFHDALGLDASERATHLAEACRGNESLRREVESLIEAFEREPNFIEEPALPLGMQVLSGGSSGALAGRSMGHYRIIRLLGKGGMGEVYLAKDSKLDRPVALKFLVPGFLGDEWAREQLRQEARAVAQLVGSNICTIYGLDEVDGRDFIVMQYVEGETLASLIRQGPLTPVRALNLAQQIISALSAAHARDIIHRDIKPQNIMVTESDHIKVLDFGLAKLVRQKKGAELTSALSPSPEVGLVIGTVAYMSPEQARGEELDCRSDIFSFGIVLYEILSGRSPFQRDTQDSTVAAIMGDDPPPLIDLPPEISADMWRVIRKCLEKRREQRYATIEELRLDLRDLEQRQDVGRLVDSRARARPKGVRLKRYAAAALLCVLLVTFMAVMRYRPPKVHTLGVLPIANDSGDPSLDYIGEGLTQNLIDKFSYLPTLRVKPATVVSLYSRRSVDPLKAGQELKVNVVLTGQLVKDGQGLLLHAYAVSVSDGSHIWEQTFHVRDADIMAMQDEIASGVASSMGVLLDGEEKRLLVKHDTDNPEAFRSYLLGRYYWGMKRNRENIRTAVGLFERAIDLDPLYAKAYAGLADSYVIMSSVAYGPQPSEEAMIKARAAAKEALSIDDELCEAHTSLGIVKLRYEWSWDEAEREFRRAIVLNPDYAPAHYWYANLLVVQGRADNSLRESKLAKDLDPFSPVSAMNYGRSLYYARMYDEADRYFSEMLAANPDDAKALYMMGLVLLQKKRYQAGIEVLQRLHAADPLFAAAPLGYAYGKVGRRAEAFDILRELDQFGGDAYVPPQEKAIVYMGLGDKNEAFNFLEEAYRERFAGLINFTTEPLFDELRPDPRFTGLARRIGLPPEHSEARPGARS